jgi:hypothetical protein
LIGDARSALDIGVQSNISKMAEKLQAKPDFGLINGLYELND